MNKQLGKFALLAALFGLAAVPGQQQRERPHKFARRIRTKQGPPRLGRPGHVDTNARCTDHMTLAGYDAAVGRWLAEGRVGPRPARCPPRRSPSAGRSE